MKSNKDSDLLVQSVYAGLGATTIEAANLGIQTSNASIGQYSDRLQIQRQAFKCLTSIRQDVNPKLESAELFLSGQIQAGTPQQHAQITSERSLDARQAVEDVFGARIGRETVCPGSLVGDVVHANIMTAAKSIMVGDIHQRDILNLSQGVQTAENTMGALISQEVGYEMFVLPKGPDYVSLVYGVVIASLIVINLAHAFLKKPR